MRGLGLPGPALLFLLLSVQAGLTGSQFGALGIGPGLGLGGLLGLECLEGFGLLEPGALFLLLGVQAGLTGGLFARSASALAWASGACWAWSAPGASASWARRRCS